MALTCCESCQFFWSCDTKWYRGERHQENICCNRCDFYRQCVEELEEDREAIS